jgi:hypothetical protein
MPRSRAVAAATVSQATGRHRRPGRRPSGKISRASGTIASGITDGASATQSARSAPAPPFASAWFAYSNASDDPVKISPPARRSQPTTFPGRRAATRPPTLA